MEGEAARMEEGSGSPNRIDIRWRHFFFKSQIYRREAPSQAMRLGGFLPAVSAAGVAVVAAEEKSGWFCSGNHSSSALGVELDGEGTGD